MAKKDCFTCRFLVSRSDSAGGGTYYCGRLSNMQPHGVVLGEWGHWTDPKIDDPKPLRDDCWKERKESV